MAIVVADAITLIKNKLGPLKTRFTDDELKAHLWSAVQTYSRFRPLHKLADITLVAGETVYPQPDDCFLVKGASVSADNNMHPYWYSLDSLDSVFDLGIRFERYEVYSRAIAARADSVRAFWSDRSGYAVIAEGDNILVLPEPAEGMAVKVNYYAYHPGTVADASYTTIREQHMEVIAKYTQGLALQALIASFAATGIVEANGGSFRQDVSRAPGQLKSLADDLLRCYNNELGGESPVGRS